MSGLLDLLRGIAGSIGKERNKSVLGIDIGSSSIKVVQLRKEDGHINLETYGEVALGPYDNKKVGEPAVLTVDNGIAALKDIITAAKITTDNVAFSIPLSSSLITLIPLSSSDPEEQKRIIPQEAKKFVPVPLSEVFFDWQIIPQSARLLGVGVESKPEALLFTVNKDIIKLFQTISKESQLDSTFFEIEVFSAIRSSVQNDPRLTMLFDMGVRYTKLYLVREGVVVASHKINRGSYDITQVLHRALSVDIQKAEEIKRYIGITSMKSPSVYKLIIGILDSVFVDVKSFVNQYTGTHNQKLDIIVLSGGGSLLPGFEGYVKNQFQVDVTMAEPFSRVEVPVYVSEILKKVGPGFSVAVGLALRKIYELS